MELEFLSIAEEHQTVPLVDETNIAPLAVVFLSGWIVKRIGPRPTMSLFMPLVLTARR